MTEKEQETVRQQREDEVIRYRMRFRKFGREYTASSTVADLEAGDLVMVRTEHGPEPAIIAGRAAGIGDGDTVTHHIQRRATREEEEKYARLPLLEEEAFAICQEHIHHLDLPMNLVRVERFFNGSKIIFYFTAESRVDFRELVKRLVQEFRTRVEMRQIGVRHEAQMTGGLGACGRELCCSSFLRKFNSVSIKMAKVQDLPLNPGKISGVCNRLLCCLTYEYDNYRTMKEGMPRPGRTIRLDGRNYRVVRQMVLDGAILTVDENGEERQMSREEWQAAKPVQKSKPRAKSRGKGKKGGRRPRKSQKKGRRDGASRDSEKKSQS